MELRVQRSALCVTTKEMYVPFSLFSPPCILAELQDPELPVIETALLGNIRLSVTATRSS
jgi:hypothetical protein